MRRVIPWLIPLVLIMIGLLWPLAFRGGSEAGPANDPVVFSNYRAEFVVDSNGQLDAVETITAEFPSGRHGIFRYWDVANPNNPRLRQIPEVTSVLLDGRPASYQMLWEDGRRFRVAKIGDPDEYLTWAPTSSRSATPSPASSTPEALAPTGNSPNPPVIPTRHPHSTGTSSRQPGTTRSNAPTSRSPCPPRSPARSARLATAWAGSAWI